MEACFTKVVDCRTIRGITSKGITSDIIYFRGYFSNFLQCLWADASACNGTRTVTYIENNGFGFSIIIATILSSKLLVIVNIHLTFCSFEMIIFLHSLFLDHRSPSLSIYPNSNSIEEGNTIIAKCSSNSSIAVTYSWYYNGKQLKFSQDFLTDSLHDQIVLKNISRKRSGNYRCGTENSFGKKVSDAMKINVQCEFRSNSLTHLLPMHPFSTP